MSLQERLGRAGELESSARGRSYGSEWPRWGRRRQAEGAEEGQDKGWLEISGETEKGQFRARRESRKNGSVRPGAGRGEGVLLKER